MQKLIVDTFKIKLNIFSVHLKIPTTYFIFFADQKLLNMFRLVDLSALFGCQVEICRRYHKIAPRRTMATTATNFITHSQRKEEKKMKVEIRPELRDNSIENA